jgi:hypothetical protein
VRFARCLVREAFALEPESRVTPQWERVA